MNGTEFHSFDFIIAFVCGHFGDMDGCLLTLEPQKLRYLQRDFLISFPLNRMKSEVINPNDVLAEIRWLQAGSHRGLMKMLHVFFIHGVAHVHQPICCSRLGSAPLIHLKNTNHSWGTSPGFVLCYAVVSCS